MVFFARLEAIRSELSQGYPLTIIYDRHQAALQIGYRSFCKLVSRYAADAKLTARHSPSANKVPPIAGPARPFAAELAVPPARPTAAGPTFEHHGIVQDGEPDLLFGPGFLPKRK